MRVTNKMLLDLRENLSGPMVKAIEATKHEFESSCSRTSEYLSWHRLFKREFTHFLNSQGIERVNIGKPNHFDMHGFFQCREQWWYFSIGDLRWSKENMLIRTANDDRDFTGGYNQYVTLCNAEKFIDAFKRIVRPDHAA